MTTSPRIDETEKTIASITPDHPAYRQLMMNSGGFVSEPNLRKWASRIYCGEPLDPSFEFSSRADLLSAIAARKDNIECMWQKLQGLIYTHAILEFLAAPIRQIPSELLLEIFSQLAPMISPLPGGAAERTVLRLVCKRWNEVSLTCNPLWSQWHIEGSAHYHPLWINATGKTNFPANLSLTLNVWTYLDNPDWPERAYNIRDRILTLKIIRNGHALDFWPSGLKYLFASGLPRLVELDITETRSSDTLFPDSLSFESLQILTLRSGYPPFALLAPQLQEFRLIGFVFESRESVEVFRGCLSISKLVVNDASFSQDWKNVPPPGFPALTDLEIDSLAILAWLSRGVADLQRVHFPSLPDSDPEWISIEDFTPMHSVKTIILDDLRFLRRRSVLLNAAMPMTQKIISTVDGLFCPELHFYLGSDHPFPRLEQLDISVNAAAADSTIIVNILFLILYQRYKISCGECHHTRQPKAECKVSIHWYGEANSIDALPIVQDATHWDLKDLYHEDLPEDALECISDVTDNSYATEVESDGEPETEDSEDSYAEDEEEVGEYEVLDCAAPNSPSFPHGSPAGSHTEVIDPEAKSQEEEYIFRDSETLLPQASSAPAATPPSPGAARARRKSSKLPRLVILRPGRGPSQTSGLGLE